MQSASPPVFPPPCPNFATQFVFLRRPVIVRWVGMTFQSGVMTTGVGGAEPAEGASGARARDYRHRRPARPAASLRPRAPALGAGAVSAQGDSDRRPRIGRGDGCDCGSSTRFRAKFGSFGFSALSLDGTKITMAQAQAFRFSRRRAAVFRHGGKGAAGRQESDDRRTAEDHGRNRNGQRRDDECQRRRRGL